MKTKHKALLLTLCAVLLVTASVVGTIAFLTDTDTVKNTFTVGQVQISLDEAKVNTAGQKLNDQDEVWKTGDTYASRVTENTYHLLPGMTYSKDPIIHVDANSENSYIFIKVDNNGIEAIEEKDTAAHSDYKTVSAQILTNGWTWWKTEGNVHYFYQEYTKGQNDRELEVFQQFKVGDAVTNQQLNDYYTSAQENNDQAKAVIVTAYAVQKAGFDDHADAWEAASFE